MAELLEQKESFPEVRERLLSGLKEYVHFLREEISKCELDAKSGEVRSSIQETGSFDGSDDAEFHIPRLDHKSACITTELGAIERSIVILGESLSNVDFFRRLNCVDSTELAAFSGESDSFFRFVAGEIQLSDEEFFELVKMLEDPGAINAMTLLRILTEYSVRKDSESVKRLLNLPRYRDRIRLIMVCYLANAEDASDIEICVNGIVEEIKECDFNGDQDEEQLSYAVSKMRSLLAILDLAEEKVSEEQRKKIVALLESVVDFYYPLNSSIIEDAANIFAHYDKWGLRDCFLEKLGSIYEHDVDDGYLYQELELRKRIVGWVNTNIVSRGEAEVKPITDAELKQYFGRYADMLRGGEIASPKDKKNRDAVLSAETDFGASVIALLQKGPSKADLFKESGFHKTLANPQAWLTVNDPELARDAVARLEGDEKMYSSLRNVLKSTSNLDLYNNNDDIFYYYADEVLDAVLNIYKGKEGTITDEMRELLAKVRYGNGTKLRFIRRDESDVKLGNRCGDCTAVGSINFDGALTGLVNPAYQILKMQRGKSFIGRMNLALGKAGGLVGGGDVLLIDALEFNPQAVEGKPLHNEAMVCFEEALGFVKDLAEKQNRILVALVRSNSSKANAILQKYGRNLVGYEEVPEDDKKNFVRLELIVPGNEIRAFLEKRGYGIDQMQYFYQCVDERINFDETPRVQDPRLSQLERDVINPAQIADPEVARLMRQRDFARAAEVILADQKRARDIKKIYNLPVDVGVSPYLVQKRLEALFPESKSLEEDLQGFMVDGTNFVLIS